LARLYFGKVNDGKVHSAFYSFLKQIKEGYFPGCDDDCYILFDIGVVEPFEDIVEYALLALLRPEDLGILNNEDEFALHLLELFIEAIEIDLGLVYYNVFIYCALSQELS
jgi:hypothetical protein